VEGKSKVKQDMKKKSHNTLTKILQNKTDNGAGEYGTANNTYDNNYMGKRKCSIRTGLVRIASQ
jgi:hypothetical protein